YLPEVESFDPDAPHSMHDREAYVRARLWGAVLTDAVQNGRTVELHEGSLADALDSLARRGFRDVARIQMPKAERFNVLRSAPHPGTGEVRSVPTEPWGRDRLIHQQLLWRSLAVDGKRLPSVQVETHQQPARSDVEVYRTFNRSLLAEPTVPEAVMVGFVNG